MKLRAGLYLILAGAAAAQELTPRQLFYQDEAPAKPAAKSAPKAAPKKAAPKAAKTEPKAATRTEAPPVLSDSPPPRQQPAPLVTAAYSAAERPLGLRYALVKVVNGSEEEVTPTATFRSGDQVRVKVEGNRDGYLYVIARGSSGVWKPLFPAPDISGGDNHVAARRGYRLPSNTQAFTFDEQPGQEQLFVIYSAEPVKDVDALIPSLAAPDRPARKELQPGTVIMATAAPIDDAFVNRLRNVYSRDLIVQTVTPADPGAPATVPEGAVYVVNKSGGRVVADIKLEHR